MSLLPVQIKRLKDEAGRGTGLEVHFSNDEVVTLDSKTLRSKCPCASCQEERGAEIHTNPLGLPRTGRALLQVVKATSEEGHDLKQLWSVGNYAVGILWGDGHDSGIYTYAFLQDLAERELQGKTLS